MESWQGFFTGLWSIFTTPKCICAAALIYATIFVGARLLQGLGLPQCRLATTFVWSIQDSHQFSQILDSLPFSLFFFPCLSAPLAHHLSGFIVSLRCALIGGHGVSFFLGMSSCQVKLKELHNACYWLRWCVLGSACCSPRKILYWLCFFALGTVPRTMCMLSC